jgi:hypothetical protein
MPQFQFNSQGIDPHYGGSGTPGLPATVNGQPFKHPVVIVASQLKPTKDNQGGYMELTLEAIDGPSKGQQQIDRLNLQNNSADAVRIANQQLSAYCAVVGVFAFNATEELHGKPFLIETKPRNDNANQFEVAKLYDMNGNEPGQAGSGAPAGQQQPPPQQQQQQQWGGQGGGQQQPPADQGGAQAASQPGWAGAGGQQQPPAGWNQGGGQGGQQQPGWGNR